MDSTNVRLIARLKSVGQGSSEEISRDEAKEISIFREIIEQDEDEAIKILANGSSRVVKFEGLRIVVGKRNNDTIIKSIKSLRDNFNWGNTTSDEVDSRVNKDCHCCRTSAFSSAVLFATLNDDPESLECLVEVWKTEHMLIEEKNHCNCAIIFACIVNYTRCIRPLYQMNYRIYLHPDDEACISSIQGMKAMANEWQFYFYLLRGKKDMSPKGLLQQQSVEEAGMENIIMNGVGNYGDEEENFVRDKIRKSRLNKKYAFCEKRDSVESFVHLKAYSNPNYLAVEFQESSSGDASLSEQEMRQLDPLRKSLAIARYTWLRSNYDRSYSEEYCKINKCCEKFAPDMLNICENMDEVSTLLEFSPDEDTEETWRVALWNNHKLLVSHPFFQNLLWKKISGNSDHWENVYIHWKIWYFIYALCIFILYPFIIFIDIVFRDNDIMFLSPDEKSAKLKGFKENRFFRWFRERLHRTVFRIIVHHFLELFFLVVVFLSVVDPKDVIGKSEYHWYDITFAIFIASYLLDDIVGLVVRKGRSFSSFWHFYKFINSSILAVGLLTYYISFRKLKHDDRSHLSGNHEANIGASIFAVGGTLALLRPLRWLLLFRSFGPLVVCVIKVIRDTAKIFFIYLIVFLAFAIGTYAMFKPFSLRRVQDGDNNNNNNITNNTYHMQRPDLTSMKGLVGALMWRVFDPGQPEYVTINYCNNTKANPCPDEEIDILKVSVEFSHCVGIILWAFYQVITVILLLNILIAMMNTTFLNIWEHSDMEWKYSKSFYQVEFLSSEAILPPPFRILYYIAEIARLCKKKLGFQDENSSIIGTNQKEEQRREYQRLVNMFLETKMKIDFERSAQDDFLDMRKDLENYMDKKESATKETILHEIKSLVGKIESLEDKISKL